MRNGEYLMQRAQSTRADVSPLLTAAASSAAQSGGACAVASGVEPSLRVGTMLVNSVAAKRVRLKRAFVISGSWLSPKKFPHPVFFLSDLFMWQNRTFHTLLCLSLLIRE